VAHPFLCMLDAHSMAAIAGKRLTLNATPMVTEWR
jgi:hypothetical protein